MKSKINQKSVSVANSCSKIFQSCLYLFMSKSTVFTTASFSQGK